MKEIGNEYFVEACKIQKVQNNINHEYENEEILV